jgi:hypothetical protein
MSHEQGLARLAEGLLNGIAAAPWHAGALAASVDMTRAHDVGKVSSSRNLPMGAGYAGAAAVLRNTSSRLMS